MKDKLTLLWTNADPVTAELMVLMYAGNALTRGWWRELEIIVWGATAKLIVENKAIQKRVLAVRDTGVKFRFCKACATELGVVSELETLGFELEFMGQPLTDALKGHGEVLSV